MASQGVEGAVGGEGKLESRRNFFITLKLVDRLAQLILPLLLLLVPSTQTLAPNLLTFHHQNELCSLLTSHL
jgi:hypothetical protein